MRVEKLNRSQEKKRKDPRVAKPSHIADGDRG